VRLADVATAAGVSVPLVSRVLNGDPSVRATDDTKARIEAIAKELGYVPDVAAKSLRMRRNGLIGLVVHDLSSPIHVELMRGVQAEASANAHFLVLGDVDELLEDERAFRTFISGNRVDGLIVQGGHGAFDERIAAGSRGLPTVIVNAPSRVERDRISSVYPDEPAGTRLLTEHLLDLGHTRIGFVSGPRDATTGILRTQGVVEALERAGRTLRPEDVVHADWTAAGGRDAFDELVTRWSGGGSRPTAVIAGNSLIGIGVLGAAHRHGLSLPDDLSVAAVHDTWISDHLVPSLTTVSLPLFEMGAAAVRQLLAGSASATDICVVDPPPLLHHRASTAPPTGSAERSGE
jgi:LacI family transcriptional regulator